MINDNPAPEDKTHEISCPCCATKLTVDAASGAILFEERPERRSTSWDEAVASGKRQQEDAVRQFEQGIERELNADELLEKKFREALKRADKSDSPPPRIFDLD